MKLHRFPGAPAAAQACAAQILEKLQRAIDERGTAYLAISGGSSPRMMFEIFAHPLTPPFPWNKVHLFWVDERAVPPTDSQSNFKLAYDTWLHPAKFPPSNTHRVVTELGAELAAESYSEEIRRCVPANAAAVPVFDVIHRGMGPDGHTASLFPGEPLIADHGGVAAAVWVEKMHQWRVTLLPGVLEASRNTVLLVTGADKTEMLKTVLHSAYNPSLHPVQIGALRDEADWFVDAAAQP